MSLRITDLPAFSGVLALDDLFEVVDVSDTSGSATGTSKKLTTDTIRALLLGSNKQSVKCAYNTAVTLNSVVVVDGTLDGLTLALDDRVLLLNQTDPIENGIWQVTSTTPIRPFDYLTGTAQAGSIIPVQGGTSAGIVYVCINSITQDVVDTYSQLFTTTSLADGDKGDITVSDYGATFTLNSGIISTSNITNFTAAVKDAAFNGNTVDTNSLTWYYDSDTGNISANVRRRLAGLTSTQGTISETGSGLVIDLGTTANVACAGNDSRLSNARTPLAHASTHQNGGSDEIATGTAAAYAIPKANSAGRLDIAWVPLGTTGTTVCVGNDARLSDSRTPTTHAATHGVGGSDAITIAESQVTNLTTDLATKIDTAGSGLTKSGTTLSISTQSVGTLLGNNTGGTAAPIALNASQVKTLLAIATGDISGLGTIATQDANNVNITGGTITGLDTPANATDAVNKAYADSVGSAIKWLEQCNAATTTAGTLSTDYAAGSTVDGVSLTTGMRLLIWNQVDYTENGIYVVNSSGAPTRSSDFDTGTAQSGAAVSILAGTANTGAGFLCTNASITIGTTNIVFIPFISGITGAAMTANNLSDLASVSTARTNLGLGTSAVANIGSTSGTVCSGTDGRLSDARVPLTHATTHQHGGTDEVATATAAANAIPKAGSGGTLDVGWIPLGTSSSTVCVGNDSRLSDARTPTTHATTHKSGGSDPIALDTLAAPTDITTLNATTSAHGLLPKLDGTSTHYLGGDGGWHAISVGTAGANAFTTTSSNFNLTAAGTTQSVSVADTSWMGVGQVLFISDGTNEAYMSVSSITNSTTVVLSNDGYAVNPATSTTISSGATVSPAGPMGPTVVGGAIAALYTFDTSTTNSDPGAGKIRLNNGTQNAATALYISKTDAQGGDETNMLVACLSSTSFTKGFVRIVNRLNTADWLLFGLTGHTNYTNYQSFTLVPAASSGTSPFTAGESVVYEFTRNGDAGTGLSPISNNTLLGNNSGSSSNPAELTATQAKTLLAIANTDVSGLGGAAVLNVGTTTGTVCAGDDSRLSDSRTPTTHASTHAAAGSDPLTLSQSQITNLTTDLAALAPLSSPALTGTPTAPTASTATSTTQIATTAFVHAVLSSISSGMIFQGSIDCSANPNYPAATQGDMYVVSVAGKIGGASGTSVDVGDAILCQTTNSGGDQATVGADFFILEHNLSGALIASNNLSDVVNVTTARSNLGLAIGTNVQAYSTDLADIAGLTPTNNDYLQYVSGAWANRTVTQVQTSLGLGTAAYVNTGTSGATIPLLNAANTFSAATILSVAGAASTPGLSLTGAPYTAGTTTTNTPQLYLNSGATAPTAWSANGTVLGANAPSGFTGNFIDLYVNGGSSVFNISYNGNTTVNSLLSSGPVQAASTNYINWSGRSRMYSPADGKIELTNAAAAGFTILQLGGTTSSFPALKVNSAALSARLADDSADAAFTAASLTVSSSTVAQNGMYLPSANTLGFSANNADTGVRIDANGGLYGYTPVINAQTGTTYTLAQSDSGKIVELNNASAITVTLPNSLTHFCCRIVQTGAGQVTLSPASGATLHNKSSWTKTSGQWAELDLYVTSNSGGAAAVYVMAGDGA